MIIEKINKYKPSSVKQRTNIGHSFTVYVVKRFVSKDCGTIVFEVKRYNSINRRRWRKLLLSMQKLIKCNLQV